CDRSSSPRLARETYRPLSERTGQDQVPAASLVVRAHTEEDRIMLSLQREFDLAGEPLFMRELAAAEAEHPRRLVIDLSELTFIDSTGLLALLRAREHGHDADWELVLRRGPDAVHRVLELTRSAEAVNGSSPGGGAA
ncbi:MAG: STAS domain-containing protein, partial [Solirubrobacteraceae bacterium]